MEDFMSRTVWFQAKRHAQGKRRNSVTARRNTQNGGCKGVRVGNLKLYMSIVSQKGQWRSKYSNKDEKNGKISSRDSDSKSKYRVKAPWFSDAKKMPIFPSNKCTCTTGKIVKILWSAARTTCANVGNLRRKFKKMVLLELHEPWSWWRPQYNINWGKRTLTVMIDQ